MLLRICIIIFNLYQTLALDVANGGVSNAILERQKRFFPFLQTAGMGVSQFELNDKNV